MEEDFSVSRLSLLERGFIYALVNVRGGGELGQRWYDGGRLFNKMNSFTDFIDVTQALVKKGFGQPDRFYAMGGSAGGLLMGAVVNQYGADALPQRGGTGAVCRRAHYDAG
nr:Protease 2 [Candidatus Pantoea persica]